MDVLFHDDSDTSPVSPPHSSSSGGGSPARASPKRTTRVKATKPKKKKKRARETVDDDHPGEGGLFQDWFQDARADGDGDRLDGSPRGKRRKRKVSDTDSDADEAAFFNTLEGVGADAGLPVDDAALQRRKQDYIARLAEVEAQRKEMSKHTELAILRNTLILLSRLLPRWTRRGMTPLPDMNEDWAHVDWPLEVRYGRIFDVSASLNRLWADAFGIKDSKDAIFSDKSIVSDREAAIRIDALDKEIAKRQEAARTWSMPELARANTAAVCKKLNQFCDMTRVELPYYFEITEADLIETNRIVDKYFPGTHDWFDYPDTETVEANAKAVDSRNSESPMLPDEESGAIADEDDNEDEVEAVSSEQHAHKKFEVREEVAADAEDAPEKTSKPGSPPAEAEDSPQQTPAGDAAVTESDHPRKHTPKSGEAAAEAEYPSKQTPEGGAAVAVADDSPKRTPEGAAAAAEAGHQTQQTPEAAAAAAQAGAPPQQTPESGAAAVAEGPQQQTADGCAAPTKAGPLKHSPEVAEGAASPKRTPERGAVDAAAKHTPKQTPEQGAAGAKDASKQTPEQSGVDVAAEDPPKRTPEAGTAAGEAGQSPKRTPARGAVADGAKDASKQTPEQNAAEAEDPPDQSPERGAATALPSNEGVIVASPGTRKKRAEALKAQMRQQLLSRGPRAAADFVEATAEVSEGEDSSEEDDLAEEDAEEVLEMFEFDEAAIAAEGGDETAVKALLRQQLEEKENAIYERLFKRGAAPVEEQAAAEPRTRRMKKLSERVIASVRLGPREPAASLLPERVSDCEEDPEELLSDRSSSPAAAAAVPTTRKPRVPRVPRVTPPPAPAKGEAGADESEIAIMARVLNAE